MKTAEEIRERIQGRLNALLNVPGMCVMCESDLEVQVRETMSDLFFIDDVDCDARAIISELDAEGVYWPSNVINGVLKVFKNIQPDAKSFDHQIASIYAAKAYEAGYLQCNNILSVREFAELKERILAGEFSAGHNLESLMEELPAPSVKTGVTTLCYVSENPDKGWIYFDLPTRYSADVGRHEFLCSIRWLAETFEEGFELTKEGYEYTSRGIAIPIFDGDTFIKDWKAGKVMPAEAGLPSFKQEPKPSRWEHLW